MAEVPRSQMALVCNGTGKYALSLTAPIPKLEPHMVLVKTIAVAINPHDYKMAEFSPTPGAVGGSDFSGVVVQIGSSVKKPFKLGDHVYGVVFGLNPLMTEVGAFSQYVTADSALLAHKPDSMTFEMAATIPIGGMTAGMALYHRWRLPLPEQPAKNPFHVLVCGGSTATGTLAIQLLKLSGLLPITTCSARNHTMVKKLGAVAAFDHHSESCASDIRNFTGGKLEYAFDCVSDSDSLQLCHQAIGDEGGTYLSLEKLATRLSNRNDIKSDWLLGLTIFGMPVKLKGDYGREHVIPEDRSFAEKWFPELDKLLHDGKVKPHPVLKRPGKFMGVLAGIEEKRTGTVSAGKLVYRIGEP